MALYELINSSSAPAHNKENAKKALLRLILSLEDTAVDDVDSEISYLRRIVDRVKLQRFID